MPSLPPHLADRIYQSIYKDRCAAYLQIDTDLMLVDAGGNLDHFGLGALQLQAPALEQVFFLEGLLPLSETPYLLPTVELATGRAADIHFRVEDGVVWIFLLDVTAEREAARRLQQKAYEMTMLQERQARLNRQLQEINAALLATQRELEASQASLIQAEKMASLGQLTAGIAHEIRNPLNFVNNFADLSVELLNEMKAAVAPALPLLAADKQAEINEILAIVADNLVKVTEHGRRADGIVRRMLEHSRGGSGNRGRVDLNTLVEEALNLAYHGALAQDQSFNVSLERDLAAGIAPIELIPQEVARVLLNLFSNGIYAVRQRQRAEGAGFKPTLKVVTRELGGAVEIRMRDNGIGIPEEVKDKLFQPFFTTKPTGEGTGLGLSISYDIVTQQHGGSITVDSKLGEYSEFTIRLPRKR